MGLFSSVALGWLGRRVLDYGGWLGSAIMATITFYNGLPPEAQTIVQLTLTQNWREITLGSLVPLFGLVVSQIQSFRATVKPQVVTPDGDKLRLDELPQGVEDTAVVVARSKPRKTLLERLRLRR